jgi:hypothetical protein
MTGLTAELVLAGGGWPCSLRRATGLQSRFPETEFGSHLVRAESGDRLMPGCDLPQAQSAEAEDELFHHPGPLGRLCNRCGKK